MDTETTAVQSGSQTNLPDHDYVSPRLKVIMPDLAFPNMIVGDTSLPRWPYLRRWVEHNWYCDRRRLHAGFASRDEASILYNTALLFQGKPCLEVGCWFGWSAVHLALGSGGLDIVDPVFGDPEFANSIRDSCAAAGVRDQVRFHEGFSPGAVDRLSQSTGTRWSLMFIDADHEGDAPKRDAEAALRNCADTAMVLFHDLASPDVAAGLDTMREAGWRTRIYQTMQIMGVAWRGDVEPVEHIPDPRVFWTLPSHLSGYEVSGWRRPTLPSGGEWWAGMTDHDRRDAALMRAQAVEDERNLALTQLREVERSTAMLEAETVTLRNDTIAVRARVEAVEADRNALSAQSHEQQNRIELLSKQLEIAQAEHTQLLVRLEIADGDKVRLEHRLEIAGDDHAQVTRRLEVAEFTIEKLSVSTRRMHAAFDRFGEFYQQVMAVGSERQHENQAVFAVSAWLVHKRVLLGLIRRSPEARIQCVRSGAESFGVAHIMTDPVVTWLCRRRMLVGLLRRPALYAQALVGCGLLQAAEAVYGRELREDASDLWKNVREMQAVRISPRHG